MRLRGQLLRECDDSASCGLAKHNPPFIDKEEAGYAEARHRAAHSRDPMGQRALRALFLSTPPPH